MGFYCNPQFTLSSVLLRVLEVLIVPYQRIVSQRNSSVVILHTKNLSYSLSLIIQRQLLNTSLFHNELINYYH